MTTWYSKSLGDGMWAPTACAEIEEKFLPLFESAGRPAGMAVFVRREEGDLHCKVIAYFSPAAKEVAEAFEALPCLKPAREGLELLAGDARCWAVLFPEGGGCSAAYVSKPIQELILFEKEQLPNHSFIILTAGEGGIRLHRAFR